MVQSLVKRIDVDGDYQDITLDSSLSGFPEPSPHVPLPQ